MMFFINLLLLALTMKVSCTRDYTSKVTLYEEDDCKGSSKIEIHNNYQSNLAESEPKFNNKASSAEVTGAWMFYDLDEFNLGENTLMEFAFGHRDYCINFVNLKMRVSSVRFAGTENGYRDDTLTIYSGKFFQGEEEMFMTDVDEIKSLKQASLVITGASGWTLFEKKNFEGLSYCVLPPQSDDFAPGFGYDFDKYLKIPKNGVKSVKKGCTGNADREIHIELATDEPSVLFKPSS